MPNRIPPRQTQPSAAATPRVARPAAPPTAPASASSVGDAGEAPQQAAIGGHGTEPLPAAPRRRRRSEAHGNAEAATTVPPTALDFGASLPAGPAGQADGTAATPLPTPPAAFHFQPADYQTPAPQAITRLLAAMQAAELENVAGPHAAPPPPPRLSTPVATSPGETFAAGAAPTSPNAGRPPRRLDTTPVGSPPRAASVETAAALGLLGVPAQLQSPLSLLAATPSGSPPADPLDSATLATPDALVRESGQNVGSQNMYVARQFVFMGSFNAPPSGARVHGTGYTYGAYAPILIPEMNPERRERFAAILDGFDALTQSPALGAMHHFDFDAIMLQPEPEVNEHLTLPAWTVAQARRDWEAMPFREPTAAEKAEICPISLRPFADIDCPVGFSAAAQQALLVAEHAALYEAYRGRQQNPMSRQPFAWSELVRLKPIGS